MLWSSAAIAPFPSTYAGSSPLTEVHQTCVPSLYPPPRQAIYFSLFSLRYIVTSNVLRVGKHESVAVWGLTPAAVSSQQHQDGAGTGSFGSSGRGDVEASPTGAGQEGEQRSMLERLNNGEDDDASDSSQSSNEDNELEITCK